MLAILILGEATASPSVFFSIDVFGGETAPASSTDARLVGLAVSLFLLRLVRNV